MSLNTVLLRSLIHHSFVMVNYNSSHKRTNHKSFSQRIIWGMKGFYTGPKPDSAVKRVEEELGRKGGSATSPFFRPQSPSWLADFYSFRLIPMQSMVQGLFYTHQLTPLACTFREKFLSNVVLCTGICTHNL